MKKLLMRIARFLMVKRNSDSVPRIAVLLFDIMLVIIAYWAVFFVKEYPEFNNINYWGTMTRSLSIIVYFIIAFCISGSYKGMVRFSGFKDIENITTTTLWVYVALFISKHLVDKVGALSFLSAFFTSKATSLLVISIAWIFMILTRLIVRRLYNEYFRPNPEIFNTVIYGAGAAGQITLNSITQDTMNQHNIISFIDDSDNKVKKSINGVAIRKPAEVLNPSFIKKHNLKTVIIAIPSLDFDRMNEIVDKMVDFGLNVKSVPHISDFIDGGNRLNASQIEDIKIEDLLGREPIKIGNENIKRELEGKVVLVTGAAGSIGSEICRQVLQNNPKHLVLLDQAESPMYDLQFELNNNEPYKHIPVPKDFVIGNVKDAVKMEEVFKKFKPQVVYHAAAYKHVPLMESFPYEAVFVNVFGTKNIADLAIKYGAEKFVMISTDKAVNPTNVMGATKRIAEIYTQSRNSATKFVTTRFGNVLGSNGSVIPLFKKQLAHGGPLTVTDRNIIRYFMTIPEACSLVLEAGSIGEDDDIFVFDMGKPVKIYDLADKMRKMSHIPNVQIEITGLRPGEKLYEELLATKENTIPTEHPKIMRAKVREYTEEEVNTEIEVLDKMLHTSDDFKIVGQMKKIVPEFKSNNSVFQILDSKKNESV